MYKCRSRDLADWWEEHQKADAHRILKDAEEWRDNEIRKNALAKLTPEEKHVLGLI